MAVVTTAMTLDRFEATFADATRTTQNLRTFWKATKLLTGEPIGVFVDYVIADPSTPLDQADWDAIYDLVQTAANTELGVGNVPTANPVTI